MKNNNKEEYESMRASAQPIGVAADAHNRSSDGASHQRRDQDEENRSYDPVSSLQAPRQRLDDGAVVGHVLCEPTIKKNA